MSNEPREEGRDVGQVDERRTAGDADRREDVDDVSDDDVSGDEAGVADEDGHEPTLAGIFGGRSEDAPPRPEIRPESVSPESALFVLLGVLLALFVFYRAATVLAA